MKINNFPTFSVRKTIVAYLVYKLFYQHYLSIAHLKAIIERVRNFNQSVGTFKLVFNGLEKLLRIRKATRCRLL